METVDEAYAAAQLAAVALLVLVGIALEDVVLELVDQASVLLVDGCGVAGHARRVAKRPGQTVTRLLTPSWSRCTTSSSPVVDRPD
jgi:hypothetical protein